MYDGRQETLNPAVVALVPLAHARSGEIGPATIVDRLMGVMIAEARRCLEEGVIKSPDDVDFALLSGAGFPAFRGGLMKYANRRG
ncbi:MAG: hypothetical protein IPL39_20345 [Opitutaceae bacterium]|nr:hypothetical protein [Opitutaceae bacterium]